MYHSHKLKLLPSEELILLMCYTVNLIII